MNIHNEAANQSAPNFISGRVRLWNSEHTGGHRWNGGLVWGVNWKTSWVF
uniref:Uncharacterized protein n=1 Tax=Anguilla anguilla TaxID=7936 RepID=A0A0E9SFN6_ANGAN